jgi:small conductance mechanosensitive channel
MDHLLAAIDVPVLPVQTVLGLVASIIIPFLFKIIGAIALWVVGGWLIRLVQRILRRTMSIGKLDITLIGFLLNIVAAVLRVILAVAILGFFGIQTASFAALLAGAGVAIGAAWSGMLGNFAAGVFLQLFRPVSVGDFVSGGGIIGTVEEIGMFSTMILSQDNLRNIVPNAKFFGDTIVNYSAHPFRRVDLFAQLDSTADLDKAITLLKQAIQTVPNQYPGKPADVELLEFNERGPKLAVRPYAHTEHYGRVYFDTNRVIYDVMERNGFPVPRIPVQMLPSP